MNTKYMIAALLLLALPSLAFAAGCGTSPTGVVACYPVNIVNNQVTATTSGFQIMFNGLPFNALQGNYLVYNGLSGARMPSWVESNSIIWTNLGANTIPASTTVNGIYYIGIGSPATNFFVSGNNIGEAPQISPSYGQYDNGNIVFNFYDNFSGSSLKAKWIANTLVIGTITVNNGLLAENAQVTMSSIYTLPTIESIPQSIEGYLIAKSPGIAMVTFGTSDDNIRYYIDYIYGKEHDSVAGGTSSSSAPFSSSQIYFGNHNVVSAYGYAGNAYLYTNYQYTGAYASPDTANTISANVLISIQNICCGNSGTLGLQWIRDRILPPNGIMPSVNYGSFGAAVPLNSLKWTISNPTIYYNQYLNLQANVSGGLPPYNYDFLLYNAAGTLVSNTLYQAVYSVANSLSYLQIPDWGSGSFKANILVTDSATIPDSATNSLTYSVNANTLYIVANAPTANYPRQIIGSNVFVENGGTEITSNVLTSLVGTISIAGIPLPQGLFASLIPINSPNIYVYTTFSNTVITTSNMTAFTTANGYASKINTYPTYIVPSSPSYQQLNIYLLPNSIASSYSMTVYSCGVLAYGDYLYVYRGASPIRGNLTDIINLQQIPFALSMDSSYPYGFQLVASNGTTIYTSAFQIWNPGLSITLQAPCAGVPVFKLPTSAASCSLAYNTTYSANTVTCLGSDPTGMVNQWNVTIYNSSGFLGLHQIASNVFNSNTFSWSYYPIAYPNPVTVKVLAYWDGSGQAWTFNLQNIMASSYNTPLNTFIVILFLLVGVAAGSMTGGSHKLSNTMFIEAFIIFFLYMAGLTSWLQAPLNGGVIIFLIVIGIFGQMKESSIMTG